MTIYEIFDDIDAPHARALYSYRWEPQTDPFGVVHAAYDYPGVPVAPGTVKRRHAVLDGIKIPLRPHFGVIAVAPREVDFIDSVPPSYFGGNLDNWRLGKGSTVYLPVSVPGALLSVGDPHATQWRRRTQRHRDRMLDDRHLRGDPAQEGRSRRTALRRSLLSPDRDCNRLGADRLQPSELPRGVRRPRQSEVYAKSSLDLAMKDAFRKMRRFLMNVKGLSEDEAIALMSAAVDFGVTQVVDGNWGVHAILSKRLFQDAP